MASPARYILHDLVTGGTSHSGSRQFCVQVLLTSGCFLSLGRHFLLEGTHPLRAFSCPVSVDTTAGGEVKGGWQGTLAGLASSPGN